MAQQWQLSRATCTRQQRKLQQRQQQRQTQRQPVLMMVSLFVVVAVVLLANSSSSISSSRSSSFFVSSFVVQNSPTARSLQVKSKSESTSTSKSSLYFWEQNSATAVLDPQSTIASGDINDDIDIDIDNVNVDDNVDEIVPFIVEELSQFKASKVSLEIADLVIKVFFEEEAELKSQNRSKGGMTPWKVMQLAYLKNLQNGDIKGKKFLLSRNINNSMFVARQIVPSNNNNNGNSKSVSENVIDVRASSSSSSSSSSSNDNGDKLFNLEYLPEGVDMYEKGPILGFVDVSEKSFGIASGKGSSGSSSGSNSDVVSKSSSSEEDSSSPINKRTLRPVLTNLSVKQEARRSGVGSALVDACEDIVMTSWSTTYDEMVLEVEEENELAQKFYEKRGYVALYADPSSRRYDTSGIILRDVRTTKICYRKDLKKNNNNSIWSDAAGAAKSGGGLFDLPFFAKVKEVVGAKR
eukprot:CAMPEP_0203667956 /NCGR_PEP_ID=MMETSP0090-20130426/4681_1 /ASSEMBLY_ACC=CAM_ASM_001088 /TAXON_ID=426623 /ORGANISM="Chaetoceros affinis, Strain CCMP159" /LENGTH=465 /DNA_ID=CAMNT_0050532255 /DNA_START=117 /DNA_END=1514 /DNA_ORIENTATION=+